MSTSGTTVMGPSEQHQQQHLLGVKSAAASTSNTAAIMEAAGSAAIRTTNGVDANFKANNAGNSHLHSCNTEQGKPNELQQNGMQNGFEDDDDAAVDADAASRRQVAITVPLPAATNKKLLLWHCFRDSDGILRNFISLPLFVYPTSSSTCATSADGMGVSKETAASMVKNDSYELALCTAANTNVDVGAIVGSALDCSPLGGSHNVNLSGGIACQHAMSSSSSPSSAGSATGVPTVAMVGAAGGGYQHHLNLNHTHQHPLLSHHSPYSNNYPMHHNGNHQHHIHSDQTKSLQELQHEVGALLEFRDLVIETFPDLKHKMASMSSSASSAAIGASVNATVSATTTLTGGVSNTSLASRREWEPGIRTKRKTSQKEPSTSSTSSATNTATNNVGTNGVELSSTSLTRSRSNSHSGKKEPKSGENNNGSVVQDSGFSTETSSSKEGHSASSTNGAMTGPIALNRITCPDDELLNLLDVIHRKSNRLREEVEHLQNYERETLQRDLRNSDATDAAMDRECATALVKSTGGTANSSNGGLTPQTFREHVERLNKEDIKQLRKERDRLLDKLAEMEAETLTGRIKAAKMSDQVEELISVKKDLEEQLKLAMAQKLELSSRVQQLQMQQQMQSKSSSSQSDYSSQRNFLSSATTVLSTGSGLQVDGVATTTIASQVRRPNTFQPVVVADYTQQLQQSHHQLNDDNTPIAFHQSARSDSRQQQQQVQQLGRLDGIVSTPGAQNTKIRATDSKRFAAILLETNVIELQRHLLTLTVQNQALMQKLEQSSKTKTHLAKRLDKSKDDVEDLRFQLEEKNIELEGTKAQLRVLESRMHSSTPSSGVANNSYLLHSQNDYETNRSSASTTLMLSRRIDSSHGSDMRSGTPISQLTAGQMPPPSNATQISTPSMKAMVHLPMDEIQQHSSSTESAHDHDHELAKTLDGNVHLLMSTSVGGVSPFEQARNQQFMKKFGAASKPSKIPLPGNKTASYLSGKPPSGRPSTAGRSPPSANASSVSHASSKSSLSRSTGNLLYAKSPNSLKRADSAQSIRKDNNNSSSLSTNTSRSSTSSSIPMATTPYGGASRHGLSATPSPRALQNSPLPKLKRETLTSRVRHLDSLSRIYQHSQNSSNSNASDASTTSPAAPTAMASNSANSYLVSSTPKPSSIVAHFNSSLRKDLSANSSHSPGSQQFLRRTTTGTTASASTANQSATARRFSSASLVATRAASRNRDDHGNEALATSHEQQIGNGSTGNGSGLHGASDSDSGKVRTLKSTFLGWLKI